MIQLLKPEDFHTQKNNANDPMNECGNTAAANYLMASKLWHYQEDGQALDNLIYKILREPICQAFTKHVAPNNVLTPERVPEVLAFCLTMMTGKEHIKYTRLDAEDLFQMILDGYPAILLGAFYKNIPYGHFITLTGVDNGVMIVADSFSGYEIRYEIAEFNRLWNNIAVIQRAAL